MIKEAFQQWDMFTGEPVTVYGRADQLPPRQMNLFPISETVQFGIAARPWLKEMPTPTLTLECQDTRTEEEKERDVMREAEKQTTPLFTDATVTPVIAEPASLIPRETVVEDGHETQNLLLDQEVKHEDTDELTELEDDETEQPVSDMPHTSPTKYESYLAIVSAAEERAATRYNTPASDLSETIVMSKAKLDARLAGLTGAEIITALTIGEFRGKAQQPSDQPEGIARTETQFVDTDAPIAVAWVSKQSLTTCRPDLTARIQELNTADMVLIAKYIRETLDKTYQMMLDMALMAYFDLGEPDDA